MKKPVTPRISTIDFLIGFVLAIAITDWFVQPHFTGEGKSYGIKLLLWAIGTVIFLAIGLVLMLVSMYVRSQFKKK